MFITKKHLSRRTFLRGASVAVGLPFLEAMVPAATALSQTAAQGKPHMGFIYFPLGALMDQWTPTAEGKEAARYGRDHNPDGFTMWMAGGGVKAGMKYGATDEFGFYSIENKVNIHDLHATLLHLLGLDHSKLTFRHAGRDFRLTDVFGEVVKDVLA